MTQIQLDATLKERLGDLTTRLEVCNERGEVIGNFVPSAGRERELSTLVEPTCTPEELAAWRADRTGKPLEEILQRLGL